MCCVYTCRSLAPYTRIFGPFAKIKWWEKFMHMHTRPPARTLFKVKHTHTQHTRARTKHICMSTVESEFGLISLVSLIQSENSIAVATTVAGCCFFSPFFNLLYFYVYILDRLFIEIHTHMRSCCIPFLYSIMMRESKCAALRIYIKYIIHSRAYI